MPRTCTICASPQHQAIIDQSLVAGTPYRAVAEHFAAGPASVYRPYKDVPFEDLVALVEKLDRLQEADVVVAEGKVIDS